MKSILFFSGLLLSLITLSTSGCKGKGNNEFQPTLADSIDVFVKLGPNKNSNSGINTYGMNSIHGNTIKYRFNPERSNIDSFNIYVDFDFTILELHPRITANLLSFIHYEMLEWGFINESDTITPFTIKEMTDKGFSQADIVKKALNWEKQLFIKEIPLIMEWETKFFMEFEIYPVFLNEEFVTYKKYAYYYTGGAHGNYSVFLQTYNLKTGESVDLDDFFIPENLDKVRELVAYHMAVMYSTDNKNINEYLDSLNKWKGLTDIRRIMGVISDKNPDRITLKNYPINDPGIHGAGLVFTYEKYHLTPGICGCPTILIPFDEIRDCLKEPFCNYHSDLNEFEIYQ